MAPHYLLFLFACIYRGPLLAGSCAGCLSCICSHGAGTVAILVSGKREQRCGGTAGSQSWGVAELGCKLGSACVQSRGLSSSLPGWRPQPALDELPGLVSGRFSLRSLWVDLPAHHFCHSVSVWEPHSQHGLRTSTLVSTGTSSSPVTDQLLWLELLNDQWLFNCPILR